MAHVDDAKGPNGIPLAPPPQQPSITLRTAVGADPKDPQYRKVRARLKKWQKYLGLGVLFTEDESDDILSEVFDEIVATHFDTVYDAIIKRRNQR